MFWSRCGEALSSGEAICGNCGQLAAAPLEVEGRGGGHLDFARVIRRLSKFWYLFAGLNLALGLMGLIAVQIGISGTAGPSEPWPHPPFWDWTFVGGSAWTLLALRILLAAAVGWGLRNHTDWSRPVAILAGAFSILQFPIGLVLGVYTLIVLFGRHHRDLYQQLG